MRVRKCGSRSVIVRQQRKADGGKKKTANLFVFVRHRWTWFMSDELPLASWVAGLAVLTAGIIVPLLLMASRHRLLPASFTRQNDGKAS